MNCPHTTRAAYAAADDALLILMAADCGVKVHTQKPPRHWSSKPRVLTPRQHGCLDQIRAAPHIAAEISESLGEPWMQNAISCCLRKLCSDKHPCATRELVARPYKGGTHQWIYRITHAGLIRLAKHEAALALEEASRAALAKWEAAQ